MLVVPQLFRAVGIKVTPRAARLAAGETRTFAAVGRLPNGTTAPIGVTWTATGGAIDPAGTYQAGSAAGTYHGIATNVPETLADTVRVRISLPVPPDTVPEPTPDPTPDPTHRTPRPIRSPTRDRRLRAWF